VPAAGTFVPLWDGLPASASAHFLGVEGVLNAMLRARRRLRRRRRRDDAATAAARAEIPVTALGGPAAAVYRRVLAPLARAEAALGLGTYARALARPLPR
jgi:hypothetical protein